MVVEYFERASAAEPLVQLSGPRAGAWVHIAGPSPDVAAVTEQFGLHASIVRDACDIRELPRAEFADGVEYIFLRLPIGAADTAKTAPLMIALSPTQLITMSVHAVFSPLAIDRFITTDTRRPGALVPAVIAASIAEYERRLRTLAEKITGARRRLRHFNVQNADFVEFVAIEDSLNEYRSSLEGLVSVLEQLQLNRRRFFTARDLEALTDVAQHSRQLLVSIHSSAKTIDSIQSAYSTIANNILNQRMKVLTIMTVLLAIPNVFYGMYGMNIGLPFQREPWAYVAILGITVLLILLTVVLAKRFRLF